MLQRLLLGISILLAASNAIGGYASAESWIPIAGQTGVFKTTVYLTNESDSTNDVTLSFYPTAQPNVAPRDMKLQLGSRRTGAVDVGPQLVGDAGATGSLRIRATAPVVAAARVYTTAEQGAVFSAIPAEHAIGTHESTLLHVSTGGRYKVYAAETRGFPLYFSVMAEPNGNERRLYLSPNEQRGWDLDELFRGMNVSALRISGVNGSGKIVVAATTVSQNGQDFAAFEMSLPTEARHRLRWPELTAYAVVAIAIVVAVILSRRT